MCHQYKIIPVCSLLGNVFVNIYEILVCEVMSTAHFSLTGRVGGKQINGYVRCRNGTEACDDLICWNYHLSVDWFSRMGAVRVAQTETELIYLTACKTVCLI